MAEPKTKYEYGSTPEQEQGGIWPLLSQLGGLFTPERREVITPSKTTYTDIDGVYFPNTTSGVYGPVERGIENMPVVQGAKSAYEFLGDLISSGKKRGETADALVKGIGTLIEDQKRAGINAAMTGQTSFYDPEKKREVAYDPLLTPATMGAAGLLAPVKGPGAVLGMFAGRNAATADPKKFTKAEEMASKDRSRGDIFKETGLFRWERNGEPISDWRYEISDEMSKAVFNPRVQTATGRLREKEKPVLSDLLQHPEFYKAYPGTKLEPVVDSLKDITLQRAALKAELVALKKRGLGKEELDAETKRLEALDGDLIRKLIDSIPTSDAPGLPPSVQSGPPFIGPEGRKARMERPVADIPLKTMDSNSWGGAYYSHYLDNIGTKARPGATPKYEHIPWDEQGKYVQQFSPYQYEQALSKASEDFKKAGMSLDSSLSGGKTEYRLRKGGGTGGPEDAINPEGLPDYLKKQWDQLQNYGKIYYKKDYDPNLEFRGNMIHEGQHSIQYRTSGFEGGGNPKEFTPALIGRVKDPQTGKNLTPTEIYMRVLGEAEARLADTRKDFTDKQRAERFPWTKEGGLDRREDDLILRKDLKKNQVGDIFSLNNAPTSKMPELKIDNPGGKWLEGKLQQAADDRRLGKSGFSGAANITGSFKEPLNLPPGLLKDIPGNLGEEALRNTGSKLVALKKSISEEGYKPSPILIHVREDGKPFVVEGNHRIVEALQSGRDTIPVELRYLRGGEGADGLLSPNRLKNFFLPEVKKASGGMVDKPLYDNSLLRGV